MSLSEKDLEQLADSIKDLKKNISLCKFCFNAFEKDPAAPDNGLCSICSAPKRDKTLLCVVEKEQDLDAIENTRKYQGLYFILGGTVGKLNPEDVGKIRIEKLKALINNPSQFGIQTDFSEIILALNPTTDGEVTALYLERTLKDSGKKITRLGRGLPTGGELEYADEETLEAAFQGRK